MKPLFAGLIALFLIAALFAPAAAHVDQLSADHASISTSAALAVNVHQVEIMTSGFNPLEMTIVVGESVNWTNLTLETVILEEGLIHTIYLPLILNQNLGTSAPVTSHTTSLAAAGISIMAGGSYSRVFSDAGTYHFYLQGHLKQQFLLTVAAQPDLEVRSVTLNPNPAAKDGTVSLTTDIYNLGLGAPSAFSVSWKLFPLGQITPLDSGLYSFTSRSVHSSGHCRPRFGCFRCGSFQQYEVG
jgi:plastocyanin